MLFGIAWWKLAIYIIVIILIITAFYASDKYIRDLLKDHDENINLIPQEYYTPEVKFVRSDPRNVKTVGSKIACEALNDIVSQKIQMDVEINGTKSIYSGKPLTVDCFEPISRIGVDYNNYSFYNYDNNDPNNRDIYEFYERLHLNENKKEQFSYLGNKLIEVPYTVDTCVGTSEGGFSCDDSTPLGVRKARIRNFLETEINKYFSG